MLPKLKRRMEEHSENVNKQLENRRKNKSEMRKTITKMKNTLEIIKSRLDDTEEWIRDMEDKIVEITQSEEQKEKKNFKKRGQFKGSLGHQMHSFTLYEYQKEKRESKGQKTYLKKKWMKIYRYT